MGQKLTNGIVNLTGLQMVAEREVRNGTLNYRPYASHAEGMDVSQQVYELMTIAAYDMLEVGQTVLSGDYTAAEMAGTVGWLHQFVWSGDYDRITISTKTFGCGFHPSQIFEQIAEWEGVMSLAPKKQHRFAVEGKELPAGTKLKPYTRCHGYKPRTISLTAENDRIAKKFEVLGRMAQSLTSEGMRRALSVLTAIKSIEKLHGHDMSLLAGKILRRKLWDDYGRDRYQQPIEFAAPAFQDGPEVWKQVDEQYVKQLIAHFREVLADSPAPTWIKKGGAVQLKNQDAAPKKWQGKLSVYRVFGGYDSVSRSIKWYADVATTKGKYDCMNREVGWFVPWVEPEKKAKTSKAKTKSTKGEGKPKQAAKASGTNNSQVVTKQSASCYQTTPEPTLEDRLREALRKQMAEYLKAA